MWLELGENGVVWTSRLGSSGKSWLLAFPSPHLAISSKAGVFQIQSLKAVSFLSVANNPAKSVLVLISVLLCDFGKLIFVKKIACIKDYSMSSSGLSLLSMYIF